MRFLSSMKVRVVIASVSYDGDGGTDCLSANLVLCHTSVLTSIIQLNVLYPEMLT